MGNAKEERRKNIEKAFVISVPGVEPSKEIMDLLEKYIEGEVTTDQIRKRFSDNFKKEHDV